MHTVFLDNLRQRPEFYKSNVQNPDLSQVTGFMMVVTLEFGQYDACQIALGLLVGQPGAALGLAASETHSTAQSSELRLSW